MGRMKKQTTAKISKVLKQSETKLLKKSNVVGVGIGEKIKDGKRTGRMSLKVYVEKKIAKEKLYKSDYFCENRVISPPAYIFKNISKKHLYFS